MAITYEPIATTTLGSAAASVTFSSISGSYTDLVLIVVPKATTGDYIRCRVGNGSVDTVLITQILILVVMVQRHLAQDIATLLTLISKCLLLVQDYKKSILKQ